MPRGWSHDAPHRAPRRATPLHCQPDTALHDAPHHHTVSQTQRSTTRHTTTLSARHSAPRRATPPHCQSDTALHGAPQHTPRLRTPQARGRHSTRYREGHRKPGVVLSFLRRLGGRLLSAGNLWITGGKPVDNSPRTLGNFHTSTSYPHFVHNLSTSYPQLIHRSRPRTACEVC